MQDQKVTCYTFDAPLFRIEFRQTFIIELIFDLFSCNSRHSGFIFCLRFGSRVSTLCSHLPLAYSNVFSLVLTLILLTVTIAHAHACKFLGLQENYFLDFINTLINYCYIHMLVNLYVYKKLTYMLVKFYVYKKIPDWS